MRTLPRDRASRSSPSHLRGPQRQVVGDVGQLLGRIARVVKAEPANDGVEHQDEALGGLHRRRVRRPPRGRASGP